MKKIKKTKLELLLEMKKILNKFGQEEPYLSNTVWWIEDLLRQIKELEKDTHAQ